MKSALVMSAGGMFGAYQAGAWSWLDGRYQPDAVVGASVGSLNGWAVAGGISGEELMNVWRDSRQGVMGRMVRRAAAGIFDPKPLTAVVRELAERYTPRVPFALTLVELPRLRVRLFQTPEITWQHLLASCSVPGLFPPVRIGRKYYVDGGLLGAMPLWAAAELGATQVVAVDVLPRMPSRLLRTAVGVIRRIAAPVPAALPAQILRICHDGPLGTVRDALYWNAAAVERWIAWGAADAARCFRLE